MSKTGLKFAKIANTTNLNIMYFVVLFYSFSLLEVPSFVVFIYLLFYAIGFVLYVKNMMALHSEYFLFLVVLSALTFNFIFQIFDYTITQLDGYYYLGLVLASSLLLTRIPINVTLKTFYIRIAVLVLILIGLFFYVLYVNQTIILLMTLLFIFKFIPFVVAYHISVIHCVPLEYSIYYVYFLPCIFIINKISKYTGSHTTITIHDIPGVDVL